MKRFHCPIIVCAFAVSACGNTGDAATSDLLHACELLGADELSQISGETVEDASAGMEIDNPGAAMSQCTYRLSNSGRSLMLQVRWSKSAIGASRKADAAELRKNDDGTGYNRQMADAVDAGGEITGFGRLAYHYEIGGTLHLVAYPDDHHAIWLWMRTDGSRDRTLDIETKAARKVLERL